MSQKNSIEDYTKRVTFIGAPQPMNVIGQCVNVPGNPLAFFAEGNMLPVYNPRVAQRVEQALLKLEIIREIWFKGKAGKEESATPFLPPKEWDEITEKLTQAAKLLDNIFEVNNEY